MEGTKRVSSARKRHYCEICDYSTPRKGDLTKHMRIHSGQKPFTCEHCSWKFKQSSHLHMHKLRKHSEESLPFKCSVCGNAYQTFTQLLNHRRSIHGLLQKPGPGKHSLLSNSPPTPEEFAASNHKRISSSARSAFQNMLAASLEESRKHEATDIPWSFLPPYVEGKTDLSNGSVPTDPSQSRANHPLDIGNLLVLAFSAPIWFEKNQTLYPPSVHLTGHHMLLIHYRQPNHPPSNLISQMRASKVVSVCLLTLSIFFW